MVGYERRKTHRQYPFIKEKGLRFSIVVLDEVTGEKDYVMVREWTSSSVESK